MSLMVRVKKRATQAREALLEHAYLITLGAAVAVVAASAMYTSRVQARHAQQVEASAGAPEIAQTAAVQTASPAVSPLPTIAPLIFGRASALCGGGRVWPVSGEMIRGYSDSEPVLWAALSCMQVHAAADIAGKAGEAVLCAMDGVVERVSRDELWGWQVCIAQTDGTSARYAGLATCDLLAGQAITRGQMVGTLMDCIPAEAELGAHLHFALEREGVPADPAAFLETAQRR